LRRAAQGDPFGEASAYRTLAKIRAARAGGVDDEGRELLQKALNAGLSRASPREAAVTRLYAAELGAPNADPSLRESAAEARAAFERMQMHHHLERAKRVEHALAAASPP
jgi:hypothetical protein